MSTEGGDPAAGGSASDTTRSAAYDAALDRIEAVAAAAPARDHAAEPTSPTEAPAPAAERPRRKAKAPGGRRRPPQRASLLGLGEGMEIWRDANGDGFVSYDNAVGVREHAPIASQAFKQRLALRSLETTGEVPGASALDDVCRIFAAQALTAPIHEPILRCGAGPGGTIVLDRCTPDGEYISVGPHGFELLSDGVPKFVRRRGMTALAAPEPGSSVSLLRPFLNVDDCGFALIVGWLLAALRPSGPYPILALSGEQGSGKSTVSTELRRLVDPSAIPISAPPKDIRDLIVNAVNSRVLAFDNLSRLDAELSDGMCRMSTGGGSRTRALHTDSTEFTFEGARPQILNGIGSLSERADLADRTIVVNLGSISETSRRGDIDLWRAFADVEPSILGALLSGVSCGLRDFETTRLERAPRLADFARWVVACEPGLGEDWAPGTFMGAYMRNRSDAREASFEGDIVATAIDRFVRSERPEGWNGTATELLTLLDARASDAVKRRKDWPFSAQGLGNRLDRAAPLLRARGISVVRRHSGIRTITLTLEEAAAHA